MKTIRTLCATAVPLLAIPLLAACGGDIEGTGGGGGAGGAGGSCPNGTSGIAHVVLVVQENHTFDNHFGRYCKAAAGSNPTCNDGPACCEGVPAKEPSGASPVVLDDTATAMFDPDHSQACELAEMNGGKMDKFVTGVDKCSDPQNFAVADDAVLKPYHDLAGKYAIADRYFQPLAGQSSANDMYLAVAKFVFLDNAVKPDTIGKDCDPSPTTARYDGQTTIVDVLAAAGKTTGVYAEGYQKMVNAKGDCPNPPKECNFHLPVYPCDYANGDIPYLYYSQHADDPKLMLDYADFAKDLAGGTLPDFSFVKALGFKTEHPGYGTKLSDGIAFATSVFDAVEATCYKNDTLVLFVWDEGGGYFDHVAPPADSAVDMKPYGTRVPLMALGRFAKKNYVSHVEMEHSSIVKFLEWLYTGKTGQLSARDATANNIGSLLDAKATGKAVPEN